MRELVFSEELRELVSSVGVELMLIFFIPVVGSEVLRKQQWFHQWSLKRWWLVFMVASIADAASTYFIIHVRSVRWTAELGVVVRGFGSLMGHDEALITFTVLVLIVSYVSACMFATSTYRAFFVWFFCVASGIRLGAAACNMLLW